MSRVLFLSLVGAPDGVSTARIVGSLASELHQRGHLVTVLTTTPHYNCDPDAERNQPIIRRRASVVGQSRDRGVVYRHVLMPRKGRSITVRLLAWLWFHLVSTAVACFALPPFDIVIAPSPPLTIGLSAWLICKIRGASFVYNVQEIYPDVAVQLGALRSRVLIGGLARLERFVYDRADAVTVISTGMEANVRGKGVPGGKLTVIPNHVDLIDPDVGMDAAAFSAVHGLSGKFVVTYAGNIGRPQSVEIVVAAAEALRLESGIQFAIVGDGAERARIESLIVTAGLTNVTMVPHQPYAAVPAIYGASHVCLVLQASGTGASVLPSKAVQIAGAGRPLLAVCDAGSDLAGFVTSTGVGLVVPPGRPDLLAGGVKQMQNDYASWSGRAQASRLEVRDAYSVEHIAGAYSRLIQRLVDRAQR